MPGYPMKPNKAKKKTKKKLKVVKGVIAPKKKKPMKRNGAKRRTY